MKTRKYFSYTEEWTPKKGKELEPLPKRVITVLLLLVMAPFLLVLILGIYTILYSVLLVKVVYETCKALVVGSD